MHSARTSRSRPSRASRELVPNHNGQPAAAPHHIAMSAADPMSARRESGCPTAEGFAAASPPRKTTTGTVRASLGSSTDTKDLARLLSLAMASCILYLVREEPFIGPY